ncbi:MAG TPA: metallophosphoesterase [Pirellulaceae bacterium]|jgi:hypothetical protein|nr:metallophosphoesterase [Pirellulaceae bacterium]
MPPLPLLLSAAALPALASALPLWALASAGHVTLFAALMSRLQGYAIPSRILHVLEKVLLAIIGLGPLVALVAALLIDPEEHLELAAVYRVWAIVTGPFFVVWAVVRLLRQIGRVSNRGPMVRRESVTNVSLKEALQRDRWSLRMAASIPRNEALRLNTIRTQIEIPRATRPREPLRIGHLTDLHLSGMLSKAFYRRAIDAALAERPDAFVITGDLVEAEECLDWVEELFRPLAEAAPTWFVLGNHDSYLPRPEALVERLERAGLVSMMGKRKRIELAGWRIDLMGDSAPWFAGFPDSSQSSADREEDDVDLTLALMHTPDRWPAARKLGVDLALAGHTHGGQIRLPIFGPLFCPSRHGSRYDRGWFISQGQRLFVSQGVAGVIPFRFLCPPEVVRIEILPAQKFTSGEPVERQDSADVPVGERA